MIMIIINNHNGIGVWFVTKCHTAAPCLPPCGTQYSVERRQWSFCVASHQPNETTFCAQNSHRQTYAADADGGCGFSLIWKCQWRFGFGNIFQCHWMCVVAECFLLLPVQRCCTAITKRTTTIDGENTHGNRLYVCTYRLSRYDDIAYLCIRYMGDVVMLFCGNSSQFFSAPLA